MAPKKKVTGLIKLQIKAGAANPAPPAWRLTSAPNPSAMVQKPK